jgi:phage shock protein A
MSDAITKRDFTVLTENAKNRIIERLVTKYDVQAAADSARDRILSAIQTLHTENQAMIRQANAQRDQLWRRITALENQIGNLQAEIRILNQAKEQSEGPTVLERANF